MWLLSISFGWLEYKFLTSNGLRGLEIRENCSYFSDQISYFKDHCLQLQIQKMPSSGMKTNSFKVSVMRIMVTLYVSVLN